MCRMHSIALNFQRTKLHLVYSLAHEVYLLKGTSLCSSILKNTDLKKMQGELGALFENCLLLLTPSVYKSNENVPLRFINIWSVTPKQHDSLLCVTCGMSEGQYFRVINNAYSSLG